MKTNTVPNSILKDTLFARQELWDDNTMTTI